MEREANYALVGAFVLLVTVMAGLFVYWYSDSREHREYTRYEIYFEGSVSGLTKGGPVRYLGVDIGRVRTLRIDKRAAGRVQVVVEIDAETPVSAGTLAELSLQGVTGLLYIDLFENNGKRKALPAPPGERYPVIRAARSNFDVFLTSLPDLVSRANDVVTRVSLILSDDNIAALSRSMANVDKASAHLPATMREVEALMSDLRATTAEVKATVVSARSVTESAGPEITVAARRVRDIADNLARTTAQLDALLAENRSDLRAFTRDGLPQFEALVRDSRAAAQEFRELARSLRENPSQVIYQPGASGVEIPR